MINLNFLALIVVARRELTATIAEFVLGDPNGDNLPAFTAGAHITVSTPSGAMRRYSLLNDGRAPGTYNIAVKKEPMSRGGSVSMHDELSEGAGISVLPPENEFRLELAEHYLLIAAGIGITPILAMARELKRHHADFKLIYCTKNSEDTAYLDTVKQEFSDELILHYDDGQMNQGYDFWDHFATPDKRHTYFCGPAALKNDLLAMSGHWPEGSFHFEDFKPIEIIRAEDKEFVVTFNTTGQTVTVAANKTILEALRAASVEIVSSCESGTCGTCKCKLLAGEADHRDSVLSAHEKKDHIMICVSRAVNGELLIDL